MPGLTKSEQKDFPPFRVPKAINQLGLSFKASLSK